jgi:hypothetical protein
VAGLRLISGRLFVQERLDQPLRSLTLYQALKHLSRRIEERVSSINFILVALVSFFFLFRCCCYFLLGRLLRREMIESEVRADCARGSTGIHRFLKYISSRLLRSRAHTDVTSWRVRRAPRIVCCAVLAAHAHGYVFPVWSLARGGEMRWWMVSEGRTGALGVLFAAFDPELEPLNCSFSL